MQTFFKFLPQEARERVLRNLCDNRSSPSSHNAPDPVDALSSVKLMHPLSNAARAIFTKVSAFSKDDDEAVFLEDNRAISEWVDVAGQLLTSLYFGYLDKHSSSQTFRRAMLCSLEKKCVAPRCLDVSTINENVFAEKILFATRGRLVKLIAESSHTPGIELYCGGLQELELDSEPSSLDFCELTVRR